MDVASLLSPKRWLSSTMPVDRASYAATGFTLMAAKYALEALLVFAVCRTFWPPWVFLSPVASMRADALAHLDDDAQVALLCVLGATSLPFLAIALSMSVRRAADAGFTPWIGLLIAVPIVNYVVMLVLAAAPSHGRVPTRPSVAPAVGALRTTLVAVGASAFVGILTAFITSDRLGLYGATVFFLLPTAMGAIAGYLVNREVDRGIGLTLGTGFAATLITAGAMLLFAIEGAICILMAAPIALVAVLVGTLMGRVVATILRTTSGPGASGAGPTMACIVLLPALAGLEHVATESTVYEVRSSVEVAASPDVVWQHVIAFPELPPAEEWYFHTGIAVPLRARIEGEGVGAVRHCEFSTGPFVEPVTTWEPGRRLAFDVTSQPAPMEEWSPYRNLHPPHLDASLRSVRGEFRLVELPNGHTRLEGSTWYTLALAPEPYFRLWSDAVIHRVHLRVLEHVRELSEGEASRVTAQ